MKAITYQLALSKFIELLTERAKSEFAIQFPSLTPPQYKLMSGQRYDKIIDENSVYCFIERSNGDILKAASYKTPAKHARGNIFNDNPLQGTTLYGPVYLKG